MTLEMNDTMRLHIRNKIIANYFKYGCHLLSIINDTAIKTLNFNRKISIIFCFLYVHMALNKILLQAYIQLSFPPLGRSQTQNNINVSIKQHLPNISVYRITVLFLTSPSSLSSY